MRKNSVLFVSICAMAMMLVAGRCSDDDDKASAGGESGAHEAAPADSGTKDGGNTAVDAGVETDPLGETMGGGGDDMTAPPANGAADVDLDDQTFESEPTPDEPSEL